MGVRKPWYLVSFILLCALFADAQDSKPQLTQQLLKNWKFKRAGDLKTGPAVTDSSHSKKKATVHSMAGAWYTAQVPGNIFTDLYASKLIADPRQPANSAKLQWVEKADWEYKCTFKADPQLLTREHINLELGGLDTYARVYLNDSLVLRCNDMFTGWDVSVKQLLRTGENTLRIDFDSPVKKGLAAYEELPYHLPADNDFAQRKLSMFTRKAAYQYGAEGGIRMVGCGILRGVSLQGWNQVRIRSVQLKQNELDAAHARMTAVFELEGAEKEGYVSLEVDCLKAGIRHISRTVSVQPGVHEVSLDFDIKKPQLWWPNGLGKAELYEVGSVLRNADGYSLDSLNQSIGLRTVELVNKPDSSGKSFYFKVNGVPVFMKGADYVPADLFPGRSAHAKYIEVFKAAVESNFNMLRVVGTGIYEQSGFYEEADRNGILIWQDFMFDGRMYPGDSAMVRTIRREAQFNIKRLRNHPSIVIWAGNSGIENNWKSGSWLTKYTYSSADSARIYEGYRNIFQNVLAAQVRRYDPGRFYLPSSGPWYGTVKQAMGSTDLHAWKVWKEEAPVSTYNFTIGRFMSEYGFQSFPAQRTMVAYNLHIDDGLDTLQAAKTAFGNPRMYHYLVDNYRTPQNFADFWYESQVQQGEAVKTAIEAHRRTRNYCMGSLYYQFNESSPGTSFAAIDYAGRNKALYYFARTAFKPILVSPSLSKGKIRVHIISDQLRELNATLKIQFYTIEGDVIMDKRMEILVYPNTSHQYFGIDRDLVLKGLDSSTVYLKTTLEKEGEVISDNILFFAPIRNIPLEEPEVTYQVQRAGKYFWLTVKCFRLAKNIFLDTKGTECKFSENFFDLLPGDSKVILVKPVKEVPDLGHILRIRTLNSLVKP